MTAEPLETQTYLPQEREQAQLESVASFLRAHVGKHGEPPTRQFFLSGAGEGDQVEVPEELHQVLVQAVAALQAGKAVTISPTSTMLTTQQAADLLGVSRPTVVRLIKDKELPAERVGNRHRVLLRDLLAFREERRNRQYATIFETSVPLEDEDDPAEVLAELKKVRKERAELRRQGHKL